MTLVLLVLTLQFFVTRIVKMNEYENVSYTTIKLKNKFGSNEEDETSMQAGDILLSNYTFLPSLDSKFMPNRAFSNIASLQYKDYSKIFKFNDDFSDYHFDLTELNKYVKFYIKILLRGTELPKTTILRSDLVACTPDMFEKLGSEA